MKKCTKCKEEKTINQYSKICDRIKKDGTKTIRVSRVCKKCMNDYHKNYRSKNRDLINKKYKDWRKKNPEKCKKYAEKMKAWEKKYQNTERGKETRSKAKKKWIKNNRVKAVETMRNCRKKLVDSYVNSLLAKSTGVNTNCLDNNAELIKVKREIIKINRLIKQK